MPRPSRKSDTQRQQELLTTLLAERDKLAADIAKQRATLEASQLRDLRAHEAHIGMLATQHGLSDKDVWPDERLALVFALGKQAVEMGLTRVDELMLAMEEAKA